MAAKSLSDASHEVLRGLLHLRPAGEKSFERLVAGLLADLTEIPFRVSRAGDQAGVDALSADSVGLEVKRYEPHRKLEERPLLGELYQAAQANPDLQVWMLATTQAVPVQLERALEKMTRGLGLGLVILDRAAAHPLPVPAIVALAAASPDRSLAALIDEEWWDTKKDTPPPPRDVPRALQTIRLHQEFEAWKARVRREVRGLPIWDRLRRVQNLRLKKRVQEHAEEFFGTGFDLDAAVPREVETKISEWFETVERAEEPSVAVVIGERYDGKTWCVYHWLVKNLDELRMPVFLFDAKQADGPRPAVKELIVREIEDILSVDAQQARRLFERFSCLEAGEGPWGLVILDGLNEYRVDPERPFQHLAHTAAQRTDLNHRPCAVLATTRTQWWQEQQARIKQSTILLEIGPYSDEELRVALAKRHEDLLVLETVQESARPLIRRPRYLQLVLDHRDRLGQFGAVTADVLHYLDAIDKMRDHGYMATGTRWDHQAYSETLSSLARTFIQESRLCSLWQRRDINRIVADLVSDPQAALRDLESEGVVTLVEGGYRVSPQRLVTGMGLWLPEALRAAKRSGENAKEALNNLLEPMKETDDKAAWLKAAVVFELFRPGESKIHGDEEILDALVDQWLRSRNLGRSDVQDAEALRPRLLPPLVRLAPRTWSEQVGDPRLQEISLLVFIDAAQQSEQSHDRRLLQAGMRAWCRFVPKTGTRLLKAADPQAEILERLRDPGVASLRLGPANDRGALKLQRAALYLESLSPGLLDTESVVAVAAIEQIAPNPLDEAERRLIRRMLAEVPRDWFHSHLAPEKKRTELWRSICHGLLSHADRVDLKTLRESVALPPDPEREKLFRQWRPTIEDHLRLAQISPSEDENVLLFTERSRRLVLDPKHPRPAHERLEAVAARVLQEFEGIHLKAGSMSTAEDHRISNITPAVAAWRPEVGVEVVESQLNDLPRRFRIDDQEQESTYYAWDLDRHSVLLRSNLRDRLQSILERKYPDDRRRVDAAMVFVALLPGMTAPLRLDAIAGHSLEWNGESFEWRRLYELAAFLADASFVKGLRTRLEIEDDPLKLVRLRLLTVEIGGLSISESQAKGIERDLTASNAGLRYAAIAAGAQGRLTSLPAELLLQLVLEEDERASLTPRYAAWLLVQKGECLDELPIYWQAVAAAVHPHRRESFLEDVERALHASLWSEGAILDPLENILIRTAPDDPVAHRVGVADDTIDSTLHIYAEDPGIGGLEELDDSKDEGMFEGVKRLFEGRPLVEKKNRLAREAARRFKAEAGNHEQVWQSEIFPQELVEFLEPERFTAWAELLLSAGPAAETLWAGLLQSMFRRALREGGHLAQGLFRRCYPFPRRGSFGVVRFMANGLHWTLHHLADPVMDEPKSRELLTELVLDCRSDLELFEVALAARLGATTRLERLVEDWLEVSDIEIRGRGVRLAGWLTGFRNRLEELHRGDPSLYVRRLAGTAMEAEDWEKWARHWLGIFVSKESPEKRWGAGQLFLECADRRMECWAPQALKSISRTRARGEAFLLLEAGHREAKNREKKLNDAFLGIKVRDLENLCHPWRPEGTWKRLEPRS